MSTCINCEQPIAQGFRFCPSCGQKTAVHRLNFHDITHDGLHYVTHADKGVLYLVLHLTKYPGKVAREYVEGKRKKYFPPLNFFLLVAGIMVFSMTFLQSFKEPVNDVTLNQRIAGMKQIPQYAAMFKAQPHLEGKLKKVFFRQDKAQRFIAKYSNFVAMFATPLLSVICFLFYYKGRYNYVEHLVANLYFAGFTSLIYALIIAPMNSAFEFNPIYFMASFFLFEIGYRAWAYAQLFQQYRTKALIKAIGIQAFVVLFWGAFSFLVMFSYIRNGFWGLLD